MTSSKASFIGMDVDLLTMNETVEKIRDAIRRRMRLHHVCMNAAKFVYLRQNQELSADIACSDLVSIDGMGVVFAARLLGIKVPERVAGVDLMQEVIALCEREGYRPYLFGATAEVLGRAIQKVRDRHPLLQVAGAHHGYFLPQDEPLIVADIRASRADCLFIGLPTPRKERFIAAHRDALGVPFIMGVGGGFDILANHVKRAPLWMQRAGFEWLYRTMQEPRRMWKRYLTTNVAFLLIVARTFLHQCFSKGDERC